jgi:epsilon-lactone hydrolase
MKLEPPDVEPISKVREMLKRLIGSPDTPFMERRAKAQAFADAFPVPQGLRIEQSALGAIPVESIIPDNAHPKRVFFHLHGGGYVLGSPAGSRPFTTAFALTTRSRVVSVDYRLAPENPHPAAVMDAVAAYGALLADGHQPGDLVIGGESAGGGLAIATLIAARDKRLPMPACAIVISPWTDLRCRSDSFSSKAGVDPMLTRKSLTEMADAYLAGANASAPLASPALADLTGLPPILIHVGSEEVLLDDAHALARNAQACRVEAAIEVWPRMIHVWHMFHPMLPEGAAAIQRAANFAERQWSRSDRQSGLSRSNAHTTTNVEERS